MWESFKAFNINAVNNFIYLMSSNFWFIFLLIGVIGTIILLLKDEVDNSIGEEQNML